MRNVKLFGQLLALLSGLLFFAGCQQDDVAAPIEERNTLSASSMTLYGLSPTNDLYTYRTGSPPQLVSEVELKGMSAGETMVAIDIRPSTKQLFGVSDQDIIYTINATDGTVTKISQEPFKPSLEGTTIGMDFNSATDKLSLLSDAQQHLILDPVSGQVVGSGLPSKFPTNGTAIVVNTIYNIDVAEGRLTKQDMSTGSSAIVGSTRIRMNGEGGFDVNQKGTAMGVFLS